MTAEAHLATLTLRVYSSSQAFPLEEEDLITDAFNKTEATLRALLSDHPHLSVESEDS